MRLSKRLLLSFLLFAAATASARGPAAKDFRLKGLDGGDLRLEDFKEPVVLLLFLSDRCGVCLQELPFLSQIHAEFLSRGLQMVALLPRSPAKESDLRRLPFPVLVATPEVLHAYRIVGYPIHYLLGPMRTLHAKHRGFHPGRERILKAEIRALLDGEDLNEDGLDLYRATGSWDGHVAAGHSYRMRTDELLAFLPSGSLRTRQWVIRELGRRKARGAAAMLGAILVSAKEPAVLRREALAALQRIGDAVSLGAYLQVAGRPKENPMLRRDAVFALAPLLSKPPAEKAVTGFLESGEANLRMAAVSILGEQCIASARGPIEALVAKEPNQVVKQAALRALENLAACE